MAAAKGVSLPEDFAAAAGAGGLRASVLEAYCKLATGGALTSWLVKSVPAFRNRLIRDRMFFFKVWAEVLIDSGGCRRRRRCWQRDCLMDGRQMGVLPLLLMPSEAWTETGGYVCWPWAARPTGDGASAQLPHPHVPSPP